jgi:hypothetical protein
VQRLKLGSKQVNQNMMGLFFVEVKNSPNFRGRHTYLSSIFDGACGEACGPT